jgi:hypothetical protein
VVGLGELWRRQRAGVPDRDKVVIPTSGKLSSVRSPLKTTDLRGVRYELGDLVLCNANIVVEDETRPGAGGQGVLVPAHDTNAGVMAVHASELGALLNVPDLHLSCAESHTHIGAIARPFDTADIGIRAGFQERTDSSGLSRPDIDIALKTDSNLVARGPVKKIEIVVVYEAWGIQNSLRGCCNAASELGRCGTGILEWAVVLRAEVNWLR